MIGRHHTWRQEELAKKGKNPRDRHPRPSSPKFAKRLGNTTTEPEPEPTPEREVTHLAPDLLDQVLAHTTTEPQPDNETPLV